MTDTSSSNNVIEFPMARVRTSAPRCKAPRERPTSNGVEPPKPTPLEPSCASTFGDIIAAYIFSDQALDAAIQGIEVTLATTIKLDDSTAPTRLMLREAIVGLLLANEGKYHPIHELAEELWHSHGPDLTQL